MKAFVAVIGFLVFAMPVAHADCGTAEKVLFSCLSAKGKRIEVCNFGQTIQYSFGKPKAKPEINVSVPISKVAGVSCYACGRYISNSVLVPNKDTIYIVSWSSDKLDTDAPSESGVEVVVNGESKATIKCCGEPVVGNFEGIVFKEPVVEN